MVVGGGLVGLTATASLKLIGHDVIVLEQAPRIRAVGAGIGLWANALREFDHLGIGPAVRDLGSEQNTWFFTPAGDRSAHLVTPTAITGSSSCHAPS
ncbi:FAD-dependent monooxygenase [Streptomyces sp. NBC_00377]|uniref:FAD-dependent oxidoreductase n=1 Tax=unclassified Streptomyces TaxID=2593676 RepID=UPI002E232F01|nr:MULTISPECIES: FAD-dependent monooxygenase [unclassified Streptomyces]